MPPVLCPLTMAMELDVEERASTSGRGPVAPRVESFPHDGRGRGHLEDDGDAKKVTISA